MAKKTNGKNGGVLKSWEKGESGNPNGRPLSFKSSYKEILSDAGSIIWVDSDKLLERTNEAGVKQFGIQLNKVQTLLSRLDRMATGKNEKLAFDVIRFLWEQMDGKAAQPLTGDPEKPITFALPPSTADTKSDTIE